MTIKIEGTIEIKKMFADMLGEGSISADKCLSVTVNQTAYQVQVRLKNEIERVFDKPTPMTKSAIRYQKKSTTKNQPSAFVFVNDHPATGALAPVHWLWHNIHGGIRELKPSEKSLLRFRKMPAGKMARPGPNMPLNTYGNITNANMVKLLSGVGALEFGSATAQSNDGYHWWATEHGVFRRKPGTSGYPETMLIYIRQSRPYKKRFDFYGVGQAEADKVMMQEAEKALDYALRNY